MESETFRISNRNLNGVWIFEFKYEFQVWIWNGISCMNFKYRNSKGIELKWKLNKGFEIEFEWMIWNGIRIKGFKWDLNTGFKTMEFEM